MITLKDKLENYEVQPDEKVWNSIENTLHSKVVARRRRIAAGAAAVVVAAAAIVIAVNAVTSQPSQPVTASAGHEIEAVGIQDDATAADIVVSNDGRVAPTAQQTLSASAAPTKVAASEETVATPIATPSATPVVSVQPQPAAAPVAKTEPTVAAPQPVVADNSVRSSEPAVEVQPQSTSAEPQHKIAQPERKVANDELVVWIPNAFAPDDPNDEVRLFKVKPNSEANLLSYEIFIYSRAGRQVYHSKDVNAGWDGTANGHQQPMGTYVYIIEINDAVKGIQHKKGTITLIR